MICENCQQLHKGSYGSGRFCSSKCARGFSTQSKRVEINQKVSQSLVGKKTNRTPVYSFSHEDRSRGQKIQIDNKRAAVLQQPFSTWSKKLRFDYLFKSQCEKCALCNMEATWNGAPLKFHLDHIDGDHSNNDERNNRLICPNCHSQTDTYCGRNKESFRRRLLSGSN